MPKEGLTDLTLNGVDLTIITEKCRTDNQIRMSDVTPLKNTKNKSKQVYLYDVHLTRNNLYQAAGYNMNKLDFAVPLPWATRDAEAKRRYKAGDKAVWYYGYKKSSTFGEPLWDSEAKKRMISKIKNRLK